MGQPIVLSVNAAWNVVNFRAGLIAGLQEAGYRVIALTPIDLYAERLANLGIEHVPIAIDARGTSPRRDAILLWNYWRILGRLKPAAYLGYTIKPNIYGSLAAHRRGIPVINNIAGLGETFGANGALNRLVRRLYRVALAKSATVFFQNEEDQRLFAEAELVTAAQSRLLPGSGVDLERFAPPVSRPSNGRFRFLLVARLLTSKGIADYVEAGRLVRAQFPQVRLQLLGIPVDGPGAVPAALLNRWQAEGAIEFLGSQDDVRPALAQADCVVLPTFYPEGTPRSLLEAAAMGLPLIASDTPGCRTIIADGTNGFLVPPRDIGRLAERMAEMVRLPVEAREKMGTASRTLVAENFGERRVIDAYLEALNRLQL